MENLSTKPLLHTLYRKLNFAGNPTLGQQLTGAGYQSKILTIPRTFTLSIPVLLPKMRIKNAKLHVKRARMKIANHGLRVIVSCYAQAQTRRNFCHRRRGFGFED